MSPPHARPSGRLRDPYQDTLTNPEIVTELKAINSTLDGHGAELKAIRERLDRMDEQIYEGFVSMGGALAEIKSPLVEIRDRLPPRASVQVEAVGP